MFSKHCLSTHALNSRNNYTENSYRKTHLLQKLNYERQHNEPPGMENAPVSCVASSSWRFGKNQIQAKYFFQAVSRRHDIQVFQYFLSLRSIKYRYPNDTSVHKNQSIDTSINPNDTWMRKSMETIFYYTTENWYKISVLD